MYPLVPGDQFCAIADRKRRFPTSRQLVRRRTRRQNQLPNRFNPRSSSQPPRPNPHSVRGTAPHPPPRFRALALFGRRSHQHVDSPVMPATKNLHRSRHGTPFDAPRKLVYHGLQSCRRDRPTSRKIKGSVTVPSAGEQSEIKLVYGVLHLRKATNACGKAIMELRSGRRGTTRRSFWGGLRNIIH